ncbi:hypothetical protein LTR08_007942 [Meristemomyces frigidus]|nr:hypothetical protein LTR08_007942 [Meristemomyces frigidus]
MAHSLASHETTEAIDVSQNRETPLDSSPAMAGPVVSETYSERIEDSYKDTTNVTLAATVEESQADPNYDELYDVSPRGAVALEASKAAMDQPTARAEAREYNEYNRGDAIIPAANAAERPASRSVIDDLLSQGATARPPQDAKSRVTTESRKVVVEVNGEIATQQAQHQPKPPPSAPHIPSQQRSVLPKKHTKAADAGGEPLASTGMSAVAALRAKNARDQAGSSRAVFEAPAPAILSDKSAPKERSKNLQTPARTDPKAAQTTEPRPTTGKLPSRRNGMFAKTPVSLPTASTQMKRKREANDESVNEENDDGSGNGESIKIAAKPKTTAPGQLRRHAAAVKGSRTAPRQSTYDLPDSSPRGSNREPAKRSRATAKAVPNPQVVSADKTAKPTKRTRQSELPNVVPKQDPKGKRKAVAEKHDLSSEAPTRKQPSRRAKMAIESSSKSPQVELEAPGAHTSPTAVHGTVDDGIQAPSKAGENIAEFMEAVLNIPDEAKLADVVSVEKVAHVKVEPVTARQEGDAVERSTVKGASQKEAILLSDRQESSSPYQSLYAPPSTAPPAPLTGARGKRHDVRAPQTPAVFNSSPPYGRQASTQPVGGGLVDLISSRKATIISFDKSGPRNQGSVSAKALGLATRSTKVPPTSEAGSHRSNFEARRKQRESSVATSMKSSTIHRTAQPSNVAESVGAALAGFYGQPAESVPSPAIATYTQVTKARETTVPHEPQHFAAASNDGFTNVDDYEGTTFVQEPAKPPVRASQRSTIPTASQQAMPPPASKPPGKTAVHRAPTVPSMLTSKKDIRVESGASTGTDSVRLKRRVAASEHEEAPVVKRPKTDITRQVLLPPPSAVAVTTNAQVQPKIHQTFKMPVPDPPKRGSRKPSRHASQGNVDLHGSPIPKGLIVETNTTVLETFSQQTDLSSDQILAEAVPTGRRECGTMQQANSAALGDHSLPPSHQPEVLSSNTKPRPASPEEDSRVFTGYAFSKVNAKQLVIRDGDALPATDPFTSSEDARKKPAKGGTSSNFAEQLRRHAAQTAMSRPRDEDDDPDKTLVDPVAQKAKPQKRLASAPSDDSSEISSSSDQTSDTMREIGIWRSALQPYQVNLFDELVNVSHRLVRHLVDHETGARDAADDYRRRGLKLIEEMERSHAQQYQQYVLDLKHRKKLIRKDLGKCKEQLNDAVAAVERAKERRAKIANERDEEERKLQELMALFS